MNNLKSLLPSLLAGLVAGIVALVGYGLIGGSADNVLGAVGLNRYPNSGFAVRSLDISTSPSSVTSLTDGAFSVSGASTLAGTVTITGNTAIDSFKSGVNSQSGSATTTALTAATLCDYGIDEWTPSVANATATLPDAVPLQADCIDARGSSNFIWFENLSNAASTTLFVAGASTTIEYVASSTVDRVVAGGDGAKIEFINSTSTTSNSAMVKYKIHIFED